MTAREWDAATYERLPLPHLGWGRRTLERLAPAGGQLILEAGCGTGRDAALLLERHPQLRLIALDGSLNMLERARERLAPYAPRVELRHVDLTRPLALDAQADGAFSVATLHWVPEHAAVFRNLAASMRPGARLAAEAGGAGNIAAVRAAIHAVPGAPEDPPWNFAGADETRAALEAAGFRDVDVRLRPDPFAIEDPEALEAYLATVVLGAHLDGLAPEARAPFVRAVATALPGSTVDYVRIELSAVRDDRDVSGLS